jgi:hypothetical protein
VFFLSLLLGWALLLSRRFFVSGELGNARRRTKNQILFALTAISYLGFVFYVAANPRITVISTSHRIRHIIDRSAVGNYREPLPSGVSPGGRYLFVFESWDPENFIVQVSIVDASSGRIVGQLAM